jgi:hypothetical protein
MRCGARRVVEDERARVGKQIAAFCCAAAGRHAAGTFTVPMLRARQPIEPGSNASGAPLARLPTVLPMAPHID